MQNLVFQGEAQLLASKNAKQALSYTGSPDVEEGACLSPGVVADGGQQWETGGSSKTQKWPYGKTLQTGSWKPRARKVWGRAFCPRTAKRGLQVATGWVKLGSQGPNAPPGNSPPEPHVAVLVESHLQGSCVPALPQSLLRGHSHRRPATVMRKDPLHRPPLVVALQ